MLNSLNVIQSRKKELKILVTILGSYFILLIFNQSNSSLILYTGFFLALICTVLIPGYYASQVLLGRNKLIHLPKVGIFYLSLICGSFLVIFESLIISLVFPLNFVYLMIINGCFAILLVLYIPSRGSRYAPTLLTPSNEEHTKGTGYRSFKPNFGWLLMICFVITLLIKSRFLLNGITNPAYLGGLDDPAFHINYSLEIIKQESVITAFQNGLFGLNYPFGFHSVIAFLTTFSGLPVIDSTRIMVFLIYSFSPIGIYLLFRSITNEKTAWYALIFWALHESVEIGWVFLNSGLFARILAYQFIFVGLLLISMKCRLSSIIIVLCAAFLTHNIAMVFLGVLLCYFVIRGILSIFNPSPRIFISQINDKFVLLKLMLHRRTTSIIFELFISVLSLVAIILALRYFYPDSLFYLLRVLGVTPSFQNWPRISVTLPPSNIFQSLETIIVQFAIYTVPAAIPIFLLALPGIYLTFKQWKQSRNLTTIDGIFLCWTFLQLLVILNTADNPFVQRIRGEIIIPLSFFAIKVLPKVENALALGINSGKSSRNLFLSILLPLIMILILNPGISAFVLLELPANNNELFSYLKLTTYKYLTYLLFFSILTYLFFSILSNKGAIKFNHEQRSILALVFILILVGGPLASNIEFIDPQETRFKSSDVDAVNWLIVNSLPKNTIIYANALHPSTPWLSYYLHNYQIVPFVSVFDFGNFEEWNEGVPYTWTKSSVGGNVSTSTDSIIGDKSLNLTLIQNSLTSISHELLIQSRRTDFYKNTLNNITLSFWVKNYPESSVYPFIQIESAIDGIDESVLLLLVPNDALYQPLPILNEEFQIPIENADWSHVFFNVSKYWFETYQQTLPARINITLGIKNYADSPITSSVQFDAFSLRSGISDIERPLLPLINNNAKSSNLTHYIFLGSRSTLNIPYGYIPYVFRQPFVESEYFMNVFSKEESEIFIFFPLTY